MPAITNLQEISQNERDGVVNLTIHGKCSGCGNCCTNWLPMSIREAKQIQQYIKTHHIQPNPKVPVWLDPNMIDLTCPFRSEAEQKCLIYPVRPLICREFLCSQDPKKIEAQKNFFWKKYDIVDMRATFCPDPLEGKRE